MCPSKESKYFKLDHSSIFVILPIIAITILLFPFPNSFAWFVTEPVYSTNDSDLIQGTPINESVIDLSLPEKDRKFHTFFKFINFDTSQKYFSVKVVNHLGDTVKDYKITVQSTYNSHATFLSQVIYQVDNNALSNNEISTGDYQLEVSTPDNSAIKSLPFTIIDSRNDSL